MSPATRTTRSITGTSVSRRIPSTDASSTCSGRTCRPTAATSMSTSRGGRPTAGPGPSPSVRGCPGSIASRSRSVATGCWRSTRIGAPAGDPCRDQRGLRADLGPWTASSWCGPATRATSRGPATPRAQEEYWNDMGAWQFGHPRGALLPSGEVLVVFYGGSGTTRSGRWARVRRVTDLLLRDARVVDARGARPGPGRTYSCGRAASRRSATALDAAALGAGEAEVVSLGGPLGHAGPHERPRSRLPRWRPGPGDRAPWREPDPDACVRSIARLEATLRAGVTTIRDVGGPGDMTIELARLIAAGEIPARGCSPAAGSSR